MNKNNLRKDALKLRYSLDNIASSLTIIDKIIKTNLISDYKNIGIYYPIKNEIDLLKLKEIYKDKKFYLPKMVNEDLEFHLYDDNLIKSSFGIYESDGKIIIKNDLDIIFIPSLVINKNGYRLGYGKGFYDRFLKDYKGIKVGVNYKELILAFDEDFWDIKLDIILTD